MSAEDDSPLRPLAARRAIVTTAGDAFSLGLARGLADAGARVALLGAPDASRPVVLQIGSAGGDAVALPCSFDDTDGVAHAFRAAADAIGAIDVIVHAWVDPAALAPRPLAELDDAGWDTCCEAPARAALFVFGAAWQAFDGRGGRLFLVTPTLSHAGAALHAAYAAACESVRALAKSAARSWASEGILVNCIAPDLTAMTPPLGAGEIPSLTGGVLGRAADPRTDVAPLVAALAGAGGHFVTGETIRVDGGSWFA